MRFTSTALVLMALILVALALLNDDIRNLMLGGRWSARLVAARDSGVRQQGKWSAPPRAAALLGAADGKDD
jgi:hypothetical protein